MKDRFVISITDLNGSKQIMLRQVIKKFLLYFILFVILVLFLGGVFIWHLNNEVRVLELKKNELKNAKQALIENSNLLKEEIDKKQEEFDMLENKISDIESFVGFAYQDENLSKRIETISITAIERKMLLDIIPNGYVIENKGITAKFGKRQHPLLKKSHFHKGIDLKASLKTPVFAPAFGIIESAVLSSSGYGNKIVISHNFGFKTVYAHLDKKLMVKKGEFVTKAQLIGYTGNSGLSTGPHLHYEVRFLNIPLDPLNFLKWDLKNFDTIFKKEEKISWQSLLKQMLHHQHLQKLQ